MRFYLGEWVKDKGKAQVATTGVIEKKGEKKGGQNQNAVNGFYTVKDPKGKEKPGQLFIKVETKKAKEFSELWTGRFIQGVISQKGLEPYQSNFALPRPGLITENAQSPKQIVIVQDRADAKPTVKRFKLFEIFRPFKTREKGAEFNQKQFAATLVMSIYAHDYSLHLGNFMQSNQDNEEVLRVDYGSAAKGLFDPAHQQNLFRSPEETKSYKEYVDTWTTNPRMQSEIENFVKTHDQELNPEIIANKAAEACQELFDTVYENASEQDMREIYIHLHGGRQDNFLAYTDEQIAQEIQELRTKEESLDEALKKAEAEQTKINQQYNNETPKTRKIRSEAIAATAKVNGLEHDKDVCQKRLDDLNKEQRERLQKSPEVKVKELKDAIVGEMRTNMKKRAEVLLEEGKKLDTRPDNVKIADLEKEIKEEKKILQSNQEMFSACHFSFVKKAKDDNIIGETKSAQEKRNEDNNNAMREDREQNNSPVPYCVEVKKKNSQGGFTSSYFTLTHLENKQSNPGNPGIKDQVVSMVQDFEAMESYSQNIEKTQARIAELEQRKASLEAPLSHSNAAQPSTAVPNPPVAPSVAQNAAVPSPPSPEPLQSNLRHRQSPPHSHLNDRKSRSSF